MNPHLSNFGNGSLLLLACASILVSFFPPEITQAQNGNTAFGQQALPSNSGTNKSEPLRQPGLDDLSTINSKKY